MNTVSGICGQRFHNKLRVTSADIKKVKTRNLKGSAKYEGESSPPPV
jgi:hypothetical protein